MNIVLGGGITGITAAFFARQRGKEAVVFEMMPRAGGLVDNFTVDGFRFDNAVHLSFAKEQEVRTIFDSTPYFAHPPLSMCWDDGYWLRHPVQNNLFPLPAEERARLIASFVNRPELEVHNYRDWLLYQFGHEIAARWPLKYTEKYWTISAEKLGLNWIGNRVRRADLSEILLGAMMPERPNYYYADEMRYPKKGGYRAFVEPMIRSCDIRCNYRVSRIDIKERTVHFADGSKADYTGLINTLPLPELIPLIPEAPSEVVEAAASLFATSLDLISIGFCRELDVSPSLWFYIYDMDIAASRVYSPSLKSPDNAPKGCSSLQFEIYSSPKRPQKMSVDELKENSLFALRKMKLADRNDVLFMHHKRLPYGNVVFDLHMEGRRDIVRAWLGKVGILTAGRFGEWDYLWSNQSFMSGKRAAERLD